MPYVTPSDKEKIKLINNIKKGGYLEMGYRTWELYDNFQRSYYGEEPQPLLNRRDFISNVALYSIDCSMQNESLKTAAVDIRIEIEARNNFPANTSAYCLILHDRITEYNPMTGDVRKRLNK
ncbi:hypothetical protein QAD02_004301 [Eretmocerus hayati]|uniref:Uncharacterized protein n=1 Tax=Eretmocerus hayati TaxID=131215 RepID=A0ACC2NPC3_9HYME|nr:hypothetical protein QAD02_004301 [Eretmocerus hayati]